MVNFHISFTNKWQLQSVDPFLYLATDINKLNNYYLELFIIYMMISEAR